MTKETARILNVSESDRLRFMQNPEHTDDEILAEALPLIKEACEKLPNDHKVNGTEVFKWKRLFGI